MKFDVVPIVRPLDLGEYDERYRGQLIWVWVSAPAAFLQRRDGLLVEYSRQAQELGRYHVQHAPGTHRLQLTALLPWKRGQVPDPAQRERTVRVAQEQMEAAVQQFNAWLDESFLPRLHAWFAELFSQGPDPELHWKVEELDTMMRGDSVLLEWIKRRASEMVLAYAEEKKRSAPRSSD